MGTTSSPPSSTQGERELGRLHALFGSNFLEPLHEHQVRSEILLLETWPAAPEVFVLEVVQRPDSARQEAAAERTVRDEADPQLSHGRQDLVADTSRPCVPSRRFSMVCLPRRVLRRRYRAAKPVGPPAANEADNFIGGHP